MSLKIILETDVALEAIVACSWFDFLSTFLSLPPSQCTLCRRDCSVEHGHTESWKQNGIRNRSVMSIVKAVVGWTNKDDEETFKGKAYSLILLDFETLSSNSDHSPGEGKMADVLLTQSLWYWLPSLQCTIERGLQNYHFRKDYNAHESSQPEVESLLVTRPYKSALMAASPSLPIKAK